MIKEKKKKKKDHGCRNITIHYYWFLVFLSLFSLSTLFYLVGYFTLLVIKLLSGGVVDALNEYFIINYYLRT